MDKIHYKPKKPGPSIIPAICAEAPETAEAKPVVKEALCNASLLVDTISNRKLYSRMLGKFNINYGSRVRIANSEEVRRETQLGHGMPSASGKRITYLTYFTRIVTFEDAPRQREGHILGIEFEHKLSSPESFTSAVCEFAEILTLERAAIALVEVEEMRASSGKIPGRIQLSRAYQALSYVIVCEVGALMNSPMEFKVEKDMGSLVNVMNELVKEVGFDNTVFLCAVDPPTPKTEVFDYISRHRVLLPYPQYPESIGAF